MSSSLDRPSKVLFVITFFWALILMVGCQPPSPTPPPVLTLTPVVDQDVGLALSAYAEDETERQLAQESGAGWDRLPMWWHTIHDRTTGELHPETYDAILSREPLSNVLAVLTSRSTYPGVVGLDIECVTRVRTGAASPKYWDGQYGFCATYQGYVYDYESESLVSSEPPLINGEPNPNNPWAMFVYRTSQHHSSRVNGWEIFNEHEAGFDSGWDPECNCETPISYTYLPPPKVYARMIRDALVVLQATNPGEPTVLGGAWEADAWALAEGRDTGWYAQVLQEINEDAEGLTSVGLHTYGRPEASYELITGLQTRTSLPFWLTETGIHIGEPDSEGNCPASGQPCGSEEEQAAYVVQQYIWALRAFRDTGRPGKVFHFAFKDLDLPWGLLQTGGPREAYNAFRFIVHTLYGATYQEWEETDNYKRAIFTIDLRFAKVTITTPIQYSESKNAARRAPSSFVPEKY